MDVDGFDEVRRMAIACKLLGSCFVVVAAFDFAKNYNAALEQRKKELRKLYSLLLQLKSELQYMSNTLPESFEKLAKVSPTPFGEWLNELTKLLETREDIIFSEAWLSKLDMLYQNSCLEKEDIEPLKELADKLGSYDLSAQLKAIDYTVLHIERNRNTLEEQIEQKKKVILTLSLFCGFMTLIFLI